VLPEALRGGNMARVTRDIAALILRLAGGAIFLPHGWPKVAGEGCPGAFAADIAAGYGIPVILGYLAAYAEVIGALLLIAGLLTRLDALLLGATMFVAAFIVLLPDTLYEVPAGAIKVFVVVQGIELPLALLAICTAVLLTGPGRLSLDHVLGIEERILRLLPKRKAAAEAAARVE
jgi:putative oxidoreductase